MDLAVSLFAVPLCGQGAKPRLGYTYVLVARLLPNMPGACGAELTLHSVGMFRSFKETLFQPFFSFLNIFSFVILKVVLSFANLLLMWVQLKFFVPLLLIVVLFV